jgi:Macrocin-O-methyltransferase (TylF)/Coenzyme PQQ synthesis protein D (PqqD)
LPEETYYRVSAAKRLARPDALLVQASNGQWRALRDSALRIWELFEYPATADQVATLIAADYDISKEQARESVLSSVVAMLESGLIDPVSEADSPLGQRFLALTKRAVLNLLYPEHELYIERLETDGAAPDSQSRQRAYRDIAAYLPERQAEILAGKRDGSKGSIRFAHSMIGKARLDNIERCAEALFAEGIAGDFLEAGVCQGGATIFMRALQVAHDQADRQTWVVDSFQGGPPADTQGDERFGLVIAEDRAPSLAFSQARVRDHFSRYGLLDDKVRFVEGWLTDSIPSAGIGPLALLRIDVDLYSSTWQALDLLYPKLVPGGFVVIDDYGYFQCCAEAVNAYRAHHAITEPMIEIDASGVYWRKAL